MPSENLGVAFSLSIEREWRGQEERRTEELEEREGEFVSNCRDD
jgi:hypothetical protein